MTTAPDTTGTTAGNSFYRYRSIKSLLGEHKELESQTIYFAGPDELNDPMEGFQDVFWEGDYVLWKNLIRHYVLCLLMSFEVVTIMSSRVQAGFGDSSFVLVRLDSSHACVKGGFDLICGGGGEGLVNCLREVGLLKQALGPPFPQDMAETTIRNLRNMLAAIERSKSSETDVTAALFSSGSRALQQMALLSFISQDNQDQVEQRMEIYRVRVP